MSSPNTSSGPRARARVAGVASLSDAELLALLIGRRTRDHQQLGMALLKEAGDLQSLARMGAPALGELAGLGDGNAWRIEAAFELGHRLQIRQAMPRKSLTHPEAIAAWFTPRIGALDHEQMWVLSLDGRNRLRGSRCVARGGSHALAVGAREILGAAVRDGASGFVLVHNHPSGSPEPSGADLEMTRQVSLAADVVGIPLLDHVVVTASGAYVSMLEHELLHNPEPADATRH
jgi:DNA repair protein RadC